MFKTSCGLTVIIVGVLVLGSFYPSLSAYANTLVFDPTTGIQLIKLDENCTAGVNKILHTQTHQNGDVLEISCNGRDYTMKITSSDGTVRFVGKCVYLHGQNLIAKVITGTLTVTAPHLIKNNNGWQTINTTDIRQNATWTGNNITKTYWTTLDATAPGTPGINEREDLRFIFDPSTKNVTKIHTLHNGTWGADGNYTTISEVIVNKTTFPAPRTAAGLAFFESPSEGRDQNVGNFPGEYVYTTPFPVTGKWNGDETVTAIVSIPHGEQSANIQILLLAENEPFSYDIDFPGEELNTIRYELLEAPEEMTLSEDGELFWIPPPDSAGEHKVVIRTQFEGLSPDVVEFVLPVRGNDVNGNSQLVIISVLAIAVIIGIGILFYKKRSK